MSGSCGRLSWPTALIDRVRRRASPRRRRRSRTCTVQRAVVVRPRRPTRPRCRSGCARAGRTRRRSAGSSRAARPGSRSGTASRGAARTSSCSCGSGCRRGSRDSVFSNHVPPTSSSFSTIDERHAGLLQPVRGEQARHAGADDRRTWKSASGAIVGLVPRRRAAVLAAVRELLLEQRQVRAPSPRRRRRTP